MATYVPAPQVRESPLAGIIPQIMEALQQKRDRGDLEEFARSHGIIGPDGSLPRNRDVARALVAQGLGSIEKQKDRTARSTEAAADRTERTTTREDTQAHQTDMLNTRMEQAQIQFDKTFQQTSDVNAANAAYREAMLTEQTAAREQRGEIAQNQLTATAEQNRLTRKHQKDLAYMQAGPRPSDFDKQVEAKATTLGLDMTNKYQKAAAVEITKGIDDIRRRGLQEYAKGRPVLGDLLNIFAGPDQAFLNDMFVNLATAKIVRAAKAGSGLSVDEAALLASKDLAEGTVLPGLDGVTKRSVIVDRLVNEVGLRRDVALKYSKFLIENQDGSSTGVTIGEITGTLGEKLPPEGRQPPPTQRPALHNPIEELLQSPRPGVQGLFDDPLGS